LRRSIGIIAGAVAITGMFRNESRLALSLLAFFLLTACSVGQSFQLFSSFTNIGGTPDEIGKELVRTSDGSLFALGSSGDGFVAAKYTNDGSLVWRAVYPAKGYSIAATEDGGAVVVGQVDRGNLPPARETITIRFGADGRIRWARYFPNASNHADASASLVVDAAGNTYVGATVNGDGNSDLAVLKYSPTGDLIWNRVLGPSPGQQWCLGVSLDPNGRVLIVGNDGSSLTGSPTAYAYGSEGNLIWTGSFSLVNTQAPAKAYAMGADGSLFFALGGENPTVLKLSTLGKTLWKTALALDRLPLSIAVGSGGVFVGGSSWLTPAGFVTQLAANGGLGWSAVTQPVAGFDFVSSLTAAADGGVVAGGTNAVGTEATLFTWSLNSAGGQNWLAPHGTAVLPGPPALPQPPLPFVPPITRVALDAVGNPITFGTLHGLGSTTGLDVALVKSGVGGFETWRISSDLEGTPDRATASSTDIDGNTYVFSEAYQAGGTNNALLKVGSDGVTQWMKDFGGSQADKAYAVATDPKLGVVAAYGAYDPATYLYNLILRRYTAAGNFVFKSIEFPGFAVQGMAIGTDKGIVVFGQDQSVVPNRLRTMKLDSAGNVLWNQVYPGNNASDDFPQRVALAPDNSVYVSGNIWDGSFYIGSVLKYGPAGDLQWVRSHLPSGVGTQIFGLAANSSGAVVSGVDFNGGRGLLLRYNPSGSLLWSFVETGIGFTSGERYMDVVFDRKGNIVVGGIGVQPTGNADILAAKFSPEGVPLWKQIYDGPAALRDLGRWVAVDNFNSVFVAGLASTPFQGRNYALLKFDENGNWEWPASGDVFSGGAVLFEAGSVLADSPAGLGVDFRGNAYVVGSAVGPTATMDPHVLKIGPTYGASLVEQSVPTAMVAGQQYTIRFTFQNTSNVPWSKALRFYLASREPNDNTTWGRKRFDLAEGEVVAPGGTRVFEFKVTAPAVPGVYRLTWGMRRDHAGHFGDSSTPVDVVVS
jgi:hypothetical protein